MGSEEMILRFCAMAIAALALTGCATGYGGSYGTYPGYSYYEHDYDDYYYDAPHYGGVNPYLAYFAHDDDDRYFRPDHGVTCDRARDICFDRYGLSYPATKRYLGEREANRSYKKYGDDVFLFSPKSGVICDRRTDDCSKERWANRRLGDRPAYKPREESRNRASIGPGQHYEGEQEQVWRRLRKMQDKDAVEKRSSRAFKDEPRRLADDDRSERLRSSRKAQRDDLDASDIVRHLRKQKSEPSGGGGCPPRGCPD